ncbi:MAG: helix-turn-helix domain-containing protein [Candidatus Diapherotrites archaeon]
MSADSQKVKTIKALLNKNPHGLWVREIARKTKLSKSTVSRYLYKYMKDDIEEEWLGRNKVVRLVR